MAKRQITQVVDDLDGTTLDDGGVTVSFALEGRSYETDLSAANAHKLRDALQPYIDSARTTGGPSRRKRSSKESDDLAAVREWARANGHKVSDRGRIPADVQAAYQSAHAR